MAATRCCAGGQFFRGPQPNRVIPAFKCLGKIALAFDAARDIFKAHQELLEDPGLLAAADVLINEGKSAGFAWRATWPNIRCPA